MWRLAKLTFKANTLGQNESGAEVAGDTYSPAPTNISVATLL